MAYASKTTVEVGKSKTQIEQLLAHAGATGFMIAWIDGSESVAFEIGGRRIRFTFATLGEDDVRFGPDGRPRRVQRSPDGSFKGAIEQAHRTRWRELLLLIKAKLVAIEAGIATVEEEFHAHIILPNGQTMQEWSAPYLKNAYVEGIMPPMLPPGKEPYQPHER